MLVNSITNIGGLFEGDLVARLVSFGVDGVTIFQELKIRVTM
jgi:hypothetical protein